MVSCPIPLTLSLQTAGDHFESDVKSRIRDLLNKGDYARALSILVGIAEAAPTFVDEFLLRIFADLKAFNGDVQLSALKIIRGCASRVRLDLCGA